MDHITAVRVARVLEKLRREKGTALLLISHEPEIVDVVMGNATDVGNSTRIGSSHPSSNGDSDENRRAWEEAKKSADKLGDAKRGGDFGRITPSSAQSQAYEKVKKLTTEIQKLESEKSSAPN